MPPLAETLKSLAMVVIPAWLAVLGTFALPAFDLEGSAVLVAFAVAETGSRYGLPVVALLILLLVVTRPGLEGRRRLQEAAVLVGVLGVFLGAGAWVNEHVLKRNLAVPRPNIELMAARGVLQTTPPEFYALGDKSARSAHLEKVLNAQRSAAALPLHPALRHHWIVETGYSFPSGHSFGAFTFCTLFLGLGLSLALAGPRLWILYALVPWAALVCYSRPILRVHSPTDVSVGALQGVVVGAVALLAARWAYGRLGPLPDESVGAVSGS